jgi:hypothetical protein
MLIDNKFLYLSLPRCASTAFHYSCILNEINVQTHNGEWETANDKIDFKSIDKTSLMNYIYHGHESLIDLQNKFGNEYPIIAVNRDRHQRFYSLYKHILFDLKRMGFERIYEKFSNLTLDELFFFTKDDVATKKQRWDKICEYLIDLKLLDEKIDISVTSKFNKSNEEYFKTNKVFVISDNTSVKTALKEKYNFECHLDEISHFSDKKGSIDSHKTTFIDFVLMSKATQIISLTVYNHYKGSGFSYWCSAIYDIPYHFLSI